MRHMSFFAVLAAAVVSVSPAAAQDEPLKIIGVFHADVANSYSSVVKKGVEQAGADLGIEVQFVGPDKFDVVAQGQLIQAAIAADPDGLFVSLPDCDALKPFVAEAIAAGIPVVSFNSGEKCFRDVGSIAHVAEDGYAGGRAAGEKLVGLGAKNTICLLHQVGNELLEERCRGMLEALEAGGAKGSVVPTDLGDPTVTRGALDAAFLRDPTIDSIGGEWGGGPTPAVVDQMLTDAGLKGKVIVSYFDPGGDTLKQVKSGEVAFVTSGVPFNVGYLPVIMLHNYIEYGVMQGGPKGIVENGGAFVDPSNVDLILGLFERGIY